MNANKNAVVIPIYQNTLSGEEVFSIENALTMLSTHDIYFVGPEYLQVFLDSLLVQLRRNHSGKTGRQIGIKLFSNKYFVSIAGYNRLMLSSVFYTRFTDYKYILIAQTDSLVLSDELDYWASKGYSYIGAPWFEGYTQPTKPLRLTSVGNGGFSLRNVPDFLKVLNQPRLFKNTLMHTWPGSWLSSTYRYLKDYHSVVFKNLQFNIDVNEDLFWGLFVAPRCPFFKVPLATEAIAFAFESHPEYLFELNDHKLPFGCHAWGRYNPQFWKDALAQKNVAGISIKNQ